MTCLNTKTIYPQTVTHLSILTRVDVGLYIATTKPNRHLKITSLNLTESELIVYTEHCYSLDVDDIAEIANDDAKFTVKVKVKCNVKDVCRQRICDC